MCVTHSVPFDELSSSLDGALNSSSSSSSSSSSELMILDFFFEAEVACFVPFTDFPLLAVLVVVEAAAVPFT